LLRRFQVLHPGQTHLNLTVERVLQAHAGDVFSHITSWKSTTLFFLLDKSSIFISLTLTK
jgi:hypothetical protein